MSEKKQPERNTHLHGNVVLHCSEKDIDARREAVTQQIENMLAAVRLGLYGSASLSLEIRP
jgi:hypothetical protein